MNEIISRNEEKAQERHTIASLRVYENHNNYNSAVLSKQKREHPLSHAWWHHYFLLSEPARQFISFSLTSKQESCIRALDALLCFCYTIPSAQREKKKREKNRLRKKSDAFGRHSNPLFSFFYLQWSHPSTIVAPKVIMIWWINYILIRKQNTIHIWLPLSPLILMNKEQNQERKKNIITEHDHRR